MRAYGNNWHDAILAEIELGSRDAYVAMAWDERLSDQVNRSYDDGLARMYLWHLGASEGGCENSNDTPWGPFEERKASPAAYYMGLATYDDPCPCGGGSCECKCHHRNHSDGSWSQEQCYRCDANRDHYSRETDNGLEDDTDAR